MASASSPMPVPTPSPSPTISAGDHTAAAITGVGSGLELVSGTGTGSGSGSGKIVAPRRRNGRPQACEPCRKRKTACDHTLPVCARCRRRQTVRDCVYLAAPMTRRSDMEGQDKPKLKPATDRSLLNHSHGHSRQSSQSDTLAHGQGQGQGQGLAGAEEDLTTRTSSLNVSTPYTSAANAVRSRHERDAVRRAHAAAELLAGGSGSYLGPTSFSATFTESCNNLGALRTPSISNGPSPGESSGQDATMMEPEAQEELVSENLIRLGLKVLEQIPAKEITEALFRGHVNPNDGWSRLAGRQLSDSVWDVWDEDTGLRLGHGNEEIVRRIFRNTATTLQEEDDADKWRASYSGKNLRWESLGILFTYWASGAISSADTDHHIASQPPPRNDRRQLMIELKECASSCITLCNAVEVSNQLFVYLLHKHNLLESNIVGDASPILWRQHGDLIAVTLSVGLHRVSDSKVTLSTELRRRLYAVVFNIDKVISIFMGRPPLLSRRYSLTRLPLDISDEALLAGGPAIDAAIAKLDKHGWARDDKIHSATLLRARTTNAVIQDEILELALGNFTAGLVDHALELKQRSHATYTQLPPAMRWRFEDVFDRDIPCSLLYARMIGHLGYLQNIFMLERLLSKHGHTNGQELLDVAGEMLKVTLNLFKHQDRFQGMHSDFEWLVMSYAVPPSGTLCVELLRQARDPSNANLVLPRSELIQNLSILVAFLDWVKPSAPNAELCYRIREIVGRVLDQALDSPPAVQNPLLGGPQIAYDLELPTNYLDLEDFGNFDLMDTFDWLG